ncbi:MAG TPA: 3-deoxy-manno-octulosonate cytidylyltransferase [Microscillaceae bacterium]|nr:3-deoxy-manno-octulosonate cytidylyltransferase [Microscillaceae bacterium]
MPKILGVIPARYNSSRLPGKALIDIGGKSMIQRVYEQALKAQKVDAVVVATDDQRIASHVESFGGQVVLTRADHLNGTTRCAEVAEKMQHDFQVAINIQGDEPFIDPAQIDLIATLFDDPQTQIATLVKQIEVPAQIFDEKEAKVVFSQAMEAIYFSRSPIPYLHNQPKGKWFELQPYFKHLGIYGFQMPILIEAAAMPPTPLELAESLEQIRWLERFTIKIAISQTDTLAIDTPDDLTKIQAYL